MKKLESLSLEKFRNNEITSLVSIVGGKECDTGCSDAPDRCTDDGDGTGCGDSEACE